MSTSSILKKATFASLIAISAAAPAAYAGLPAPSFNDFPEHYGDGSVVQESGVKGGTGASITTSEARLPAPSFNDHTEHYAGATPVGAKAATQAKATAGARGNAASYVSLQRGLPAF